MGWRSVVVVGIAAMLVWAASASSSRAEGTLGSAISPPASQPETTPAPSTAGWNWNYRLDTYLADLRRPVKPEPLQRPYTFDVAWQDIRSIPLEVGALAGIEIGIGLNAWDWGSSHFHFHSEGWFGQSTYAGGADKVGHAYASYVLSDFLTWRLYSRGFNAYESAITAALISSVGMLAVEVGDGFSKDDGFSYEDLTADAVGIAFSFLRNTVPGIRDKLDFRMQYIPTGHESVLGNTDYSGKKFLLALKLAGFADFKPTPLRYLELQAGYFTRGYSEFEQQAHLPKTRHLYAGLGLNLSELLFSHPAVHDTVPGVIGRTVLEYVEVPYTYIATDNRR